jgi:hypothetical protein
MFSREDVQATLLLLSEASIRIYRMQVQLMKLFSANAYCIAPFMFSFSRM